MPPARAVRPLNDIRLPQREAEMVIFGINSLFELVFNIIYVPRKLIVHRGRCVEHDSNMKQEQED